MPNSPIESSYSSYQDPIIKSSSTLPSTRPKLSPHDLNTTRNSYFLINNNNLNQEITTGMNSGSSGGTIVNGTGSCGNPFELGHTRTSSQTSIGSQQQHSIRGPPSPLIPISSSSIASTSTSTHIPTIPSLSLSMFTKRPHPSSSSSSSSATSTSNHRPSPSATLHSNRYKQFTPASIISLLSPSLSTLSTLNTPVENLPSASTSTSTSTASPSILLLDIRTHTSFIECRFLSSVNICVPSTLLRRPNYGVDRISEGLMPLERVEFEKWSSVDHILVLDLDSQSLKEGGGISSLLAKFSTAGYEGSLGWCKGGFMALKAEAKLNSSGGRNLLQYGEGDSIDGESQTSQGFMSSNHTITGSSLHSSSSSRPPTPGSRPQQQTRPLLNVRDLPVSAFQQASTSAFSHAGLPSASLNMGARPNTSSSSKNSSTSKPGLGKRRKSGGNEAFGLSINMPTGGHSAGSSTPGGNSIAEKRMATNPFFDNIRQNSEALSLTRSLANLSPVDLPSLSPHSTALLPPFLSSLLKLSPMERAQLLARQFYELEVAERERLEGTLNWHATVQDKEGETLIEESSGYRKFGISAGVELGNLNRFKNIFPYDCARVRLQVANSSSTDYINASHIHIQTSPKRFIASQGPLPTTFSDFYQVCFQEKVGVIIMLTNLQEGGRDKCGNYWKSDHNDLWDVKVEGGEEPDEISTGFFNAPKTKEEKAQEAASADSTIRRTFYIRRKGDSNPANVRKIRHIQYRAWPDFDVPASPSDLVDLVREVEQAQSDYLKEVEWKGGVEDDPPIMTHCSGGIGRTGVFIAVLTLLDKLRRDREMTRRLNLVEEEERTSRRGRLDDDMDVDSSPIPLQRADNSYNSTSSSSSTGRSSTQSSSPPSSSAFSNVLPSPTFSEAHSSTSDNTTASLAANLQSSTLESPHNSRHNSTTSVHSEPSPSSSSAPSPSKLIPTHSHSHSQIKSTIPPPLLRHDPIFASVNEMREQRMSMVATLRQYVSIYEATLVGYLDLLKN